MYRWITIDLSVSLISSSSSPSSVMFRSFVIVSVTASPLPELHRLYYCGLRFQTGDCLCGVFRAVMSVAWNWRFIVVNSTVIFNGRFLITQVASFGHWFPPMHTYALCIHIPVA